MHTCSLCEPDKSASCMGLSPFSQRKSSSKWVPPAHSLHYLEPGSQPQARGGDRRPLSSGWHAGGPESWATRVSKRECFEESPPFLGPGLSSCHLSGIPLWWDGAILASYLLCVLSSFLLLVLSISSTAPCVSLLELQKEALFGLEPTQTPACSEASVPTSDPTTSNQSEHGNHS